MPWSERLQFALRQSLDRGRGLSAFLSRLSMIGLVLALALLLSVMSVMNGFEKEMRERILGLVPHVTLRAYTPMLDWQARRTQLLTMPNVLAVNAFYDTDVLFVRGTRVEATRLLGVDSDTLQRYQPLLSTALAQLDEQQLILGAMLAKRLGAVVGDRLTLLAPTESGDRQTQTARPKRYVVAALLATGTELDEKLAIADLSSVAAFAGAGGQISGLALQVADLFDAPQLRRDIARTLPPTQYVSDWTSSQGNLYAAIRLSRDIITLLLLSIIAVAAFNVVSSLVLVVTDRRRAIAMLSALGASGRDIQAIFLLQGLVIGVIGAAIGSLAGLSLAFAAPHLAQGLEGLLGVQLLNTDVYPLAFLPVDIRLRDFVIADLAAIVLCVLAAVLPARRAANMPVAEILAS